MFKIKKVLKRAFTIVELVVVIAVIAALAAVLIPTFANVINSANNSSDVQSVKNMNTALAAEGTNKPTSLCGVWEVLEENGYSSEVSPNYSANTFYWYKEGNCIVIVQEGKITYPTEYEGITIAEARTNAGGKVTVAATVTADTLTLNSEVMLLNTDKDDASAHEGSYSTYGDTCSVCGRTLGTTEKFSEVITTLTATNPITLVSDLTYDVNTEDKGHSTDYSYFASIKFTSGGKLDLGGNTISISSSSGKNGIYTQTNTVTLKNGTVTMDYSYNGASYGVIRNNGGNLTLDNMTVKLTGTGYCVNNNGTISIKDTTIISNSENETTTYSLYVASSSKATISGNSKIVGIMYVYNSATVTIEDGDFTECTFKCNSTGVKPITVKGGTFKENPSDNSLMTVAEGYSVVDNKDGTYTVKASG